jgi:arylsulfatase A-like enzyme
MILSRRHFFFGSLALAPLAAAKSTGDRPNVLLILVDGLPAWILSCYGGKDVQTPSIDQLAASGVRFRNHFAASPSAGPGRASLLTGRTALQLGGGESIPSDEVSLARILGGLGYACLAADTGASDAVVAQTVKFIDEQTAGRPFFLTAGFTDLVPPYDGVAQKYRDLYAKTPFDSCFPSQPPAASARGGREMLPDLLGSLRKVAAAITALDDRVGSLIARLKQRQLMDDTLIVFTSTSGSLYGRHGLWGSGEASAPVNMYEETVLTPMILRWPVRLPPQTSRPESVSACDFVPTLCELTGAALPSRNLSGRSYLALAMGKPLPPKQPWHNAVFSHLQDTDMVRDSLYKLVLRDGGKGPNEFYDLLTDPREGTNGYGDGQYASIRPSLAAEIAKWKQRFSS